MDSIFIDYEDSLIGRKNEIGAYQFYGRTPGGANQQRAITVIRYALETLLRWNKADILQKFDEYIIRKMKLTKLLNYIDWPVEVEKGDPHYILYLLFPDDVKMDGHSLAEQTLRYVLDGKGSFPREYFSGTDGYYRYCICIRYLIDNNLVFYNLDDLYSFFLSEKGNAFLEKNRVKVPAEMLGINIIDVLHDLTKDETNSDIIYLFHKFLLEHKSIVAKLESNSKFKN